MDRWTGGPVDRWTGQASRLGWLVARAVVSRLGCPSPALSMSLSMSREPDERCSRLMLRLKLKAGLTSRSGVRASNRDQRTNLTTEYLDLRTHHAAEKAAAKEISPREHRFANLLDPAGQPCTGGIQMRRSSRLLSLVSLVAAAACAPAGGAGKSDSATTAADTAAIGKARDAFAAAFKAGDIAAITALYTSRRVDADEQSADGYRSGGNCRLVQGALRPDHHRRFHADAGEDRSRRETSATTSGRTRSPPRQSRRATRSRRKGGTSSCCARVRMGHGRRSRTWTTFRLRRRPCPPLPRRRASRVESDYSCPTSGPHSSTSFLYAGSSYLDGRNHFA